MHARIALYFFLTMFFCLGATPQVNAAATDNEPEPQVETLYDDNPFEDNPFENETDAGAISETQFPDPIQGFNRGAFTFTPNA